jgi:regulator of replication initiation timing
MVYHMTVDELSQEFLKVLLEYSGDADTTTIRSETGMSRGQIQHRYKKLSNLNWINIERAESGAGERTPPKIAIITEEGMQAIRSGEAGPKVLGKEVSDEDDTLELTRDQLDSFYQEIEGMKNQLNVVVDQVNNTQDSPSQNSNDNTESFDGSDSKRVKELEKEVGRLSETVNLLNKSLSEQRKKESKHYSEIEEKLEERLDGDEIDKELVEELKSKQESIDEWKSVAEIYMRAMRLYMQDDGVDVNEYFQKAKESM